MNRRHQIEQTLKKNLDDNERNRQNIEFILVDFNTSGLFDWVVNNFSHQLKQGYLKYYFTEEMKFWHASIAKNTAHYLASHDILVNLDCDNFTGSHGGRFLQQEFNTHGANNVIHQFNGNLLDGTFGRISVHRDFFLKIGGYDESFAPMGYQDLDLIRRLQALGLSYKLVKNKKYCRAITNTISV